MTFKNTMHAIVPLYAAELPKDLTMKVELVTRHIGERNPRSTIVDADSVTRVGPRDAFDPFRDLLHVTMPIPDEWVGDSEATARVRLQLEKTLFHLCDPPGESLISIGARSGYPLPGLKTHLTLSVDREAANAIVDFSSRDNPYDQQRTRQASIWREQFYDSVRKAHATPDNPITDYRVMSPFDSTLHEDGYRMASGLNLSHDKLREECSRQIGSVMEATLFPAGANAVDAALRGDLRRVSKQNRDGHEAIDNFFKHTSRWTDGTSLDDAMLEIIARGTGLAVALGPNWKQSPATQELKEAVRGALIDVGLAIMADHNALGRQGLFHIADETRRDQATSAIDRLTKPIERTMTAGRSPLE